MFVEGLQVSIYVRIARNTKLNLKKYFLVFFDIRHRLPVTVIATYCIDNLRRQICLLT